MSNSFILADIAQSNCFLEVDYAVKLPENCNSYQISEFSNCLLP